MKDVKKVINKIFNCFNSLKKIKLMASALRKKKQTKFLWKLTLKFSIKKFNKNLSAINSLWFYPLLIFFF